MTGEDARKVSASGDIFQGLDIISGPIVEAFFLQNKTKTLLLLDEFMQASLFKYVSEKFCKTSTLYRSICIRIPKITKQISKPPSPLFISPYAREAQGSAN
jgi:hypothetical protein